MSLNKRKRVTRIANSKREYPQLTLNQALDLVIAGKRAEELRDRTLKDYAKMWGYFTDWLNGSYEVEFIEELNADVFLNYINYKKYDRRRYDGHKYINFEIQPIGLADTTIWITDSRTNEFTCRRY